MDAGEKPVVFVHGLWLHAESWSSWVDRFTETGYAASALGWPGDGATVVETRAHPGAVAGRGIQAVADHYASIIRSMATKPVVVGHSFGGLIAQRLLGEDLAAAAVAIDPAPPKGVLFLPLSAFRVAGVAPRNPANKKRAVSLTSKQFRNGFGNALSPADSEELYQRWTIPSPGRPLFEAATAGFARRSPATVATKNASRGRLLITAGGRDHTVPRIVAKQNFRLYRSSSAVTDFTEFPDRGHSLTIDRGWRDVADAVLAWLKHHSL
jgi:pimeloyl-ACP methyl ester carboxylesterase